MTHESGTHDNINSGDGGHESGDFGRTSGVSGTIAIHVQARISLQLLLSFQFLQMSYCQFEDIGFFQFGNGFAFGLQGKNHQILEVIETLVDPGSPFSFKQRLHDFSVLVSTRHGSVFNSVGFDLQRFEVVGEVVLVVGNDWCHF